MFVFIEIKYKFSICLPKRTVVLTFVIEVLISTALLRCHICKAGWILYILYMVLCFVYFCLIL
jgi:hypothetical protein